ncbi:MAG: 50S ribosomal protein L29 [Lentisphaerae bacterium]|nr:50S ribosomal protein L29 [Lentisphaerota bacterium]
MKAKQLRELSKDELGAKLAETERELLNLRLRKSSGQIEQPLRLRALRREIARIQTLQNQGERA